ncbi:ATP-binding protein [Ornithinimicrobium cavernae]|uniref:ATP-binding protein n=1 Tax=Ornithinimicrobium cavernae TaxID=2666047 RepID=UPI000D691516|nr:tetratricopeptide repeat protein [Ornithinimicrobium cavernae]
MSTGPGLPEGTITMLFSDIEGSTQLLHRLGAGYREVLSEQRRIIRRAVQTHHGHEMGTEGDSFYVVFASAGEAVRAAIEAQRALRDVTVGGGGHLRVRMGLHTGEPDRHEDGYIGMDVHRAARVAAAANGGQIVLTPATWALAEGQVSATVRDLGRHRLKDISEPEHLLRLVVPDLVEEDRPVRTMGAPASLPRPATPLVAREDLVGDVARLLLDSDLRLVTLLGPGGVGKTRLAIAVAERCAERVRDGVFYVGLAETRSTEDVWTAIADATGIPASERERGDLLAWLRDRDLLLVLDNLEQLPDIHQVITQLLNRTLAPELLLTSRRPVHVVGERLVPVPPLGPDDAVELFLQRLATVRPDHVADRAVVRQLCERVDGLPLAIELLAARGQLLTPRAMLDRFSGGLDLRSRAHDVPERQRSLTAVLDWSYHLLSPAGATAFRRLGALAGGFGVGDAAAVLDVAEDEAIDQLLDLVEASLVRTVEAPGGEPEFRLLHVIGTYAAHRLADDPDEQIVVRSRLAEHVRGWVEEVAAGLRSPRHLSARDQLGRRHPLFRRVLEHALEPDSPDAATGLRLCADLSFYWYSCGYATEGARWLSQVQRASAGLDGPVVNRALHGVAIMLMQQGRVAEAESMLRRTLAAWRSAGDTDRTSVALNSLALARRVQGDAREAGVLFREAIVLASRSANPQLQVNAKSNLALLELDLGDPQESLRLFREVLELDTTLGDPWGIFADHVNIATALLVAGDSAGAGRVLREHGTAALELGDTDLSLEVVENLACVCVARQLDDVAAALVGAARSGRDAAVLPRVGPDLERLERLLAPARDRLGEAWEAAVGAGADRTLEDAFAHGLAALTTEEPPAVRSAGERRPVP